jgi:elongation factor G
MRTELSVATFAYLGEPRTVVDCPGSLELVYEAQRAMAVADGMMVVCEPQSERGVAVSPLRHFLDD